MICFERVTYTYPEQPAPALADFSASIEPGEFILVVGPSGAGKSTFLRCFNGLVPHFYGGRWAGQVRVFDRDPVALAPRGMADLVGFVCQDPEAQFVVDTVEDELAFALENFALPQATMRKRVEEVLDQVGVAHLRFRRINTLSGGEKQRVAIASVLALQPEVLVLDEPTSQLDPQAAEEVLVTLRQLNEDLGLTIILSEHRLERVVQYVDRVLYFPGTGAPAVFEDPRSVMAQLPLVPPLIHLGRELGWQPLPLTIKEGRTWLRRSGAGGLGSKRLGVPEAQATGKPDGKGEGWLARLFKPQGGARLPEGAARTALPSSPSTASAPPPALVSVRDLQYAYSGRPALRGVSLDVPGGELVALMGRNGSGKSTLLKHLVGLLKPENGQVVVTGLDTRSATPEAIVQQVGYVPQHPGALLFQETLADELAFTRRSHRLPADTEGDLALLARLGLAQVARRDPRDLSGGEQQRAALAAILVAGPQVLLLDEPTRGLDYAQKRTLADLLLGLKREGRSIIMATHDVELAAACADRVVLLAEGEVIVDGPARSVMSDSQVFASQINKLFRDPRFLSVEDALRELGSGPDAWAAPHAE